MMTNKEIVDILSRGETVTINGVIYYSVDDFTAAHGNLETATPTPEANNSSSEETFEPNKMVVNTPPPPPVTEFKV